MKDDLSGLNFNISLDDNEKNQGAFMSKNGAQENMNVDVPLYG